MNLFDNVNFGIFLLGIPTTSGNTGVVAGGVIVIIIVLLVVGVALAVIFRFL